MSKTIKCTNPGCGSLIPVPEGAQQVICSLCNTWHFPTSENDNDSKEEGYGTPEGYSGPPAPEQNYSSGQEEGVPPPIVPESNVGGYEFNEPDVVHPNIESAPSSDQIIAYLITDNGIRLGLSEGQNVIGRKNADLIIDDKTISRRHCVIEAIGTENNRYEFFIYDIGHLEGKSSTNGVFVSGRSLRLQDYERVPIGNGTAIRLGNIGLVFSDSS